VCTAGRLRSHGEVLAVGVEGTGAYGSVLGRYLHANQVTVMDVDRPDRKKPGARMASPSRSTPTVPPPRSFRVGPAPPRKLVTASWRQSAPCAWYAAPRSSPAHRRSTRSAVELGPLVAQAAPDLVAVFGIGTETAAQLLITAGDNPDRLEPEASFAHLCAAAPIPASSGVAYRHRLNRGRTARQTTPCTPPPSPACAMPPNPRLRRPTHHRRDVRKGILRCLKRFIAREVYKHLTSPSTTTDPLLQAAWRV
jgi:transposase